MQTPIAQRLDIEFPIFAFTHCRDVVAAVCNTGAMGVLGAVGFTVEQLKAELDWLDEHVEGTYGVDIVIPGKYEGMDEMDPDQLEEMLKGMIPDEVREFARSIFDDAGVPSLTEEEKPHELLGFGMATAMPLLEEALSRPKCSLIANALGTPPEDVIAHVQSSGRLIGALCGSVKHAKAHEAAGLDFVVCQGGEGGGHTGDVGSVVLWPEVIEAIDIPVLAAGGVGSRRPTSRPARWTPTWRRRAATPSARGPGPASRAACSATTGPTRGSGPTPRTRSGCRCSRWCPWRRWPAATGTRPRPRT